jgi:hypothetical protein
MLNTRAAVSLLISILFASTLILINFKLPTSVQAEPLAGFTPSPGDDDDDGGGDPSQPPASQPDDDSGGDEPTDYVIVRLDQCDLSCSVGAADSETSDFEPLASVVHEGLPYPASVPIIPRTTPIEVIAPVKLVHDGSGFIVDGVLSTHDMTRFSVPYTGRWEVLLTGQLEFMTAEAVDVTGTNLAQLALDVSAGPISLGAVEANVVEVQTVKCPLACVIETPPAVEAAPYLPETGSDFSHSSILSVLGWIVGFGLVVYAVITSLNSKPTSPDQ